MSRTNTGARASSGSARRIKGRPPPLPVRPRQPDPKSFEARWFTANESPVAPVATAPLETRRGYRPPSPSSGLVSAAVALVLVAVAVTGLVFYFSPPDSKHEHPVSTTSVTSSEGWRAEPETPSTAPPSTVPVVTAKDLPSAPPSRTARPPRPNPVKGAPPAAEFKIKR